MRFQNSFVPSRLHNFFSCSRLGDTVNLFLLALSLWTIGSVVVTKNNYTEHFKGGPSFLSSLPVHVDAREKRDYRWLKAAELSRQWSSKLVDDHYKRRGFEYGESVSMDHPISETPSAENSSSYSHILAILWWPRTIVGLIGFISAINAIVETMQSESTRNMPLCSLYACECLAVRNALSVLTDLFVSLVPVGQSPVCLLYQ
jgi:hypothetical protein